MTARPTVPALITAAAATFALTACSSSASHGSKASDASHPSNPGVAASSAGSTSAGGTSAGSSPAGSGAATSGDTSALLLPAGELGVPGATLSGTQAVPGASGVMGLYTASHGRRLGDSIILLPTAGAAKTALQGAGSAVAKEVTASVTKDVPVGDGGHYYSGNSPDGSNAVAVVIFTKGKAFVTLEFTSAAGDPVPEALARSIADKQAARLP